jgi:hypothetical protein
VTIAGGIVMTADHTTAARRQGTRGHVPHRRGSSAEPSCELWQEHARRSFAAARGSGSGEIDPVRLFQTRRIQPTGDFIRRLGLARALREANRT